MIMLTDADLAHLIYERNCRIMGVLFFYSHLAAKTLGDPSTVHVPELIHHFRDKSVPLTRSKVSRDEE